MFKSQGTSLLRVPVKTQKQIACSQGAQGVNVCLFQKGGMGTLKGEMGLKQDQILARQTLNLGVLCSASVAHSMNFKGLGRPSPIPFLAIELTVILMGWFCELPRIFLSRHSVVWHL